MRLFALVFVVFKHNSNNTGVIGKESLSTEHFYNKFNKKIIVIMNCTCHIYFVTKHNATIFMFIVE